MVQVFKSLLAVSACLALTIPAVAECPSADFTGDCAVDFKDLAVLSSEWTADAGPDDMILIPGGTFEMGDSFAEGETAELPVHTVTLSPFYMSRFETTSAQFCEFLNAAFQAGEIVVDDDEVRGVGEYGPTYFHFVPHTCIVFADGVFSVRRIGERDLSDEPAGFVDWHGAAAYCNWRSRREGRQPCYDTALWTCDFTRDGYRLPTEAEWEYAARGGLSGKRFPWGDTISHDQANYASRDEFAYDVSATRGLHPVWGQGEPPYTAPVGSFAPNGYGLYDMIGNVPEWCNSALTPYESGHLTDPIHHPSSGFGWDRVKRGGGCVSSASWCRIAARPQFPMGDTGIRLCRSAEGPAADLTGEDHIDSEDLLLLSMQWLTRGDRPNEMVAIPGGTFQMGDTTPESGVPHYPEAPVHQVTLSPFLLAAHEVTNAQYCQFLNSAFRKGRIKVQQGGVSGTDAYLLSYYGTHEAHPHSFISFTNSRFTVLPKAGRDMSDDPVVNVSWHGAVAYCNWRSEQEGLDPCYRLDEQQQWRFDPDKSGYRLPTEAQWEYAARGGLPASRFPWGDTITHDQANYTSRDTYSYDVSPTRGSHPTWNDGVFPYTAPVASFPPNGYGLYDMAGNVQEWCNDWYDEAYYTAESQVDPQGPDEGFMRVVRDGAWDSGRNARYCRVASRDARDTTTYYSDIPSKIGFRICR